MARRETESSTPPADPRTAEHQSAEQTQAAIAEQVHPECRKQRRAKCWLKPKNSKHVPKNVGPCRNTVESCRTNIRQMQKVQKKRKPYTKRMGNAARNCKNNATPYTLWERTSRECCVPEFCVAERCLRGTCGVQGNAHSMWLSQNYPILVGIRVCIYLLLCYRILAISFQCFACCVLGRTALVCAYRRGQYS